MEIKVVTEDILGINTPAIIIGLYEDSKELDGVPKILDEAMGGAISQLRNGQEIKGSSGEFTLIHTLGRIPAQRILVSGLGRKNNFDLNTVRALMGNASRYLRARGILSFCTTAYGIESGILKPVGCGQAIAEGAILGTYQFHNYRTNMENQGNTEEITIVSRESDLSDSLEIGVRQGEMIASGVALSRDMSNTPANDLTPSKMAEIATTVAREGNLDITILDRSNMEKLGMGALVGVARGSHQPPKLIALEYKGDPDRPKHVLGLIGKGVTFDTGGISLKPALNMENMKGDMTGGSSVIGAMKAISALKPKINVTGVVPTTENMPGGDAQRPGDIVRAMNDKTIEVINTDAEGRLILSDAMVYAVRKLGVSHMVDIATLTGAIIVSLGSVRIGVFGNNEEWIDQVVRTGNDGGERMWPFPMDDDYGEQLKSTFADMMNVGGKEAGSITAAKFLSEFTEGVPWVHLDIAGSYRMSADKGWHVKGSSGGPVRTLINLALADSF